MGNRFEFFDAGKFALVRPAGSKRITRDDFYRAPGSHYISRQPHFTVCALPNAGIERVVGNTWNCGWLRSNHPIVVQVSIDESLPLSEFDYVTSNARNSFFR